MSSQEAFMKWARENNESLPNHVIRSLAESAFLAGFAACKDSAIDGYDDEDRYGK